MYSGGYFEIEMLLESRDQQQADALVAALHRHPALEDGPPGETRSGLLRLHDGQTVVRVEGQIPFDDEDMPFIVWLGVPMEALGTVWPQVGAYPFSGGGEWVLELSNWLAGIAETAFEEAPFDAALIGFESSDDDLDQLRERGVPSGPRWLGYLVREDGALRWYPPTVVEPPMEISGPPDDDS
jgi:hypothetical protein